VLRKLTTGQQAHKSRRVHMRAPDTNAVKVAGNIATDPVVHQFESGNGVIRLFVINNKLVNGRKGPYEKSTRFTVDVWGKNEDIATSTLKKGDAVLIEGELDLNEWKTKEGESRSRLQVTAQIELVKKLGGNAAEEAIDNAAEAAEIKTDEQILF